MGQKKIKPHPRWDKGGALTIQCVSIGIGGEPIIAYTTLYHHVLHKWWCALWAGLHSIVFQHQQLRSCSCMCSLRNVYVDYVTHWSSRSGAWLTPMTVLVSAVSQVCWSRVLNFAIRNSLWVGVQLVGSCCRVEEPSNNDWPVSTWLPAVGGVNWIWNGPVQRRQCFSRSSLKQQPNHLVGGCGEV